MNEVTSFYLKEMRFCFVMDHIQKCLASCLRILPLVNEWDGGYFDCTNCANHLRNRQIKI